MSIPPEIERFYALLDRLAAGVGGARRLGDCHGRMAWPKRGVYFILDPTEPRPGAPGRHRVVRVGTHALKAGAKSTLWGRLRQHRGSEDGNGNHRGSIFRLLVGEAMIRRDYYPIPGWGVGAQRGGAAAPEEKEHERRVSDYLCDLHVVWLEVPDEPGPNSGRAYLETNAIALLSTMPVASSGWLGQYSSWLLVRGSGLWNNQHVGEEPDGKFLEEFERSVSIFGDAQSKAREVWGVAGIGQSDGA